MNFKLLSSNFNSPYENKQLPKVQRRLAQLKILNLLFYVIFRVVLVFVKFLKVDSNRQGHRFYLKLNNNLEQISDQILYFLVF